MGWTVTAFAYSYPTKADRAAAQYRSRKPQAEVSFEVEGGDPYRFSVPARVARAFAKEEPETPVAYEAARDALLALDARICFSTLTELLASRDCFEAEVREKLRSIGFRGASIDAAVGRAKEAHFLDNDRFMRYFIEERKRRGWGRRKIEVELKRKGVDPTMLSDYPEAFFSDDEDRERARDLLARKRIPEQRAYEKLARFLVGKGFSWRTASDVARERIDTAAGEHAV